MSWEMNFAVCWKWTFSGAAGGKHNKMSDREEGDLKKKKNEKMKLFSYHQLLDGWWETSYPWTETLCVPNLPSERKRDTRGNKLDCSHQHKCTEEDYHHWGKNMNIWNWRKKLQNPRRKSQNCKNKQKEELHFFPVVLTSLPYTLNLKCKN